MNHSCLIRMFFVFFQHFFWRDRLSSRPNHVVSQISLAFWFLQSVVYWMVLRIETSIERARVYF